MVEYRFELLGVLRQFLRVVKQAKAVALTVQVKHRQVGQFGHTHLGGVKGGEVVHRREHIHQRAGAGDELVEVGGQHAVKAFVFQQLRQANMCPVDF